MASFLLLLNQWLDANADVYAGAKANVYLTGTTTQSDSYQDSGLTTPHTNPVVADSAGRFAAIYLDQSITYKVVVTDASDNTLQTIDPVQTELGTGNTPISSLIPAANRMIYYTSASAAALTPLSSYARSNILQVANELGFQQSVNLEIGVDTQAYHERLDDISGLTYAQGDILYYNGTNIVNLGAGTNEQVLRTQGAGANPIWSDEQGGFQYVETQEPTSDTSTITFSTDISIYKSIQIEVVRNQTSASFFGVQVRTTSGTWRTVAFSSIIADTSSLAMDLFQINSIDNADGEILLTVWCLSSGNTSDVLDRSDNADTTQSVGGDEGTNGISSFDETINEVRLLCDQGNFTGTGSSDRTIARLYGAK